MSDKFTSLRAFFQAPPDNFKDAPCAGVAIIIATKSAPYVARTMEEDNFIELCRTATLGRSIPTESVQ